MTASVCNSLLLSHFNCVTEELNTVSNVYQLIRRQSCHHIETSQLICLANQLIGFYTMATLAFNELIISTQAINITILEHLILLHIADLIILQNFVLSGKFSCSKSHIFNVFLKRHALILLLTKTFLPSLDFSLLYDFFK